MALRLPYPELSPGALAGIRAVGANLDSCSLGRKMIELIYLRISQINGCDFCLKKHAKVLREEGETQERLDCLAGWHASTAFSARERAALAWAEALTDIAATHAPDDLFAALREHFTDQEISDLTFAAAIMNAFNRLAIGMRQ
jgi:uncharacterized peroxidase-related enzyme